MYCRIHVIYMIKGEEVLRNQNNLIVEFMFDKF